MGSVADRKLNQARGGLRRNYLRGWITCVLALALWPTSVLAEPFCSNSQAPPPRRIVLLPGSTESIELGQHDHGTLIEELGGDVSIGLDGGEPAREIAIKPPRLGVAAIPGDVRRVSLQLRASQGSASVALWSNCADSAQMNFYARLAGLADGTYQPDQIRDVVISELEKSSSLRERAWWLLVDANALLTAGRSTEAARAFRIAADAWAALGDSARAGVATLAAAEDASRAGAYDDAEQGFRVAIESLRKSGLQYYEQRAQAALCTLATRRGQIKAGLLCEAQVAARLAALGERAEAGARHVSIANQWLKLGDLDRARALLLLADRDIEALTPAVRGRLSLAFGSWHLQAGDLVAASREFTAASRRFDNAGLPHDQAIVDLKLARLANMAGAVTEEQRLLARAIAVLPEGSAPEHLATAYLRLAQAHLRQDQFEAAQTALDQTITHCTQIGKHDCLERAALAEIELQLELGKADQARALLARLPPLQLAASKPYQMILEARRQLLAGDPDKAIAILSPKASQQWEAGLATERARILASALAALEKPFQARDELVSALATLNEVTTTWPATVLKISARSHMVRLQAAFFDLIDDPEGSDLPPTTWTQLVRAVDYGAEQGPQHGKQVQLLPTEQRSTLSEFLLTDAPIDSRALFVGLIGIGGTEQSSAVKSGREKTPTLTIAQGDLLLLPLVGERNFVLLGMTGTQARICARTSRSHYEAAVRRYENALSGLPTELESLDAEATSWFEQISSCVTNSEGTDRWLLVATPGAPQLPWVWFAARAETLDAEPSVSISFRIPAYSEPKASSNVRATIVNLNLPGTDRLPFAKAEQARILKALEQHAIPAAVREAEWNSAETLLRAMTVNAPWVHVIGHGNSPDYGPLYAGIWFPTETQTALLAYPDIAASPSDTELLVLSACGAGPGNLSPQSVNLILAEAFIAAGTGHVVAATNALSDSAAPFWTEIFYNALLRDGDVDTALRAARQGLRRSPHFKHPRFWAGLNSYSTELRQLSSDPPSVASTIDRIPAHGFLPN